MARVRYDSYDDAFPRDVGSESVDCVNVGVGWFEGVTAL